MAGEMKPLEDPGWFNLNISDTNHDISPPFWATMDAIFSGDNATITHSPTLHNHAMVPTDTSTDGTFAGVTREELFTIQNNPETSTHPRAVSHPSATFDIEPSVQLAIIQRDLSIQASALKSIPWNLRNVMRVTSTVDHRLPVPNQTTDYNPLAKIVTTTKDFTVFLRTLRYSMGISNEDLNSASVISLSHPSLSVTDVLTVLSCHMLTLSIYETIFSSFLEQAPRDPGLVQELLQSTPQLFVGGIPVPPRLDMLGHLFYCLVGSLLQPIEILLGLPNDFCVSLQRDRAGDDNENGLFSGQSGRTLFSTILKMEEKMPEDGSAGPGVIVSLKEKIRRIQDLS